MFFFVKLSQINVKRQICDRYKHDVQIIAKQIARKINFELEKNLSFLYIFLLFRLEVGYTDF